MTKKERDEQTKYNQTNIQTIIQTNKSPDIKMDSQVKKESLKTEREIIIIFTKSTQQILKKSGNIVCILYHFL